MKKKILNFIDTYWIVAVATIFLIGYVKNIIHLTDCDFKGPWKAEILYGIGCLTGLGTFFGWMNFGK